MDFFGYVVVILKILRRVDIRKLNFRQNLAKFFEICADFIQKPSKIAQNGKKGVRNLKRLKILVINES